MKKQTPQKFAVVSIPVKPYVKRFLEINYGMPADFVGDPETHRFFQDLLRKPDISNDKKYPDTFCTYSTEAEVLISEDVFYRYGWELTKTNVVAFGRKFEARAKVMMRTVVGVNVSLGIPVNKSIERFQERFRFLEDVWGYEAIKKDFYRHGAVNVVDFEHEIFRKIENIILENLSVLGTISPKAKKYYENN